MIVTGGAGFLGSHVVGQLLDLGYEVAVIDNLHSGTLGNLYEGVDFYESDISSVSLDNIFESVKPDIVIHLAAQISVQASMHDPVFDARINVEGSLNIIDLCTRYRVGKMIYASSGGAIYGEPETLPIIEDTDKMPMSPYALQKWIGEQYCKLFSSMHNQAIKIE